jgi:hypothetical protein
MVADPHSFRSVDPDPDPGRKNPHKKGNKKITNNNVLKRKWSPC